MTTTATTTTTAAKSRVTEADLLKKGIKGAFCVMLRRNSALKKGSSGQAYKKIKEVEEKILSAKLDYTKTFSKEAAAKLWQSVIGDKKHSTELENFVNANSSTGKQDLATINPFI